MDSWSAPLAPVPKLTDHVAGGLGVMNPGDWSEMPLPVNTYMAGFCLVGLLELRKPLMLTDCDLASDPISRTEHINAKGEGKGSGKERSKAG